MLALAEGESGEIADAITDVIDRSAVIPLLERSRHGAVVLERIVRGGGATRWCFLRQLEQLKTLQDLLQPGSVVSFYFDQWMSENALARSRQSHRAAEHPELRRLRLESRQRSESPGRAEGAGGRETVQTNATQ